MHYHVAPGHSLYYTVRISDISWKYIERLPYFWGSVVQPSPGIKGVVHDESSHIMTLFYQFLGEMRANKTVCACNEDFLSFRDQHIGAFHCIPPEYPSKTSVMPCLL